MKKCKLLSILFCISYIMILSCQSADAKSYGTVKSGKENITVRTGPGTGYDRLKTDNVNVTVSSGDKITITAKYGSWYYGSFKYKGVKYRGYVQKKYINVRTGKIYTSVPGTLSYKTSKLLASADSKSEPLSFDGAALVLTKGSDVKIISEVIIDKCKWYRINTTIDGNTVRGYIKAKKIKAKYTKAGIPAYVSCKKGKKTAVLLSPSKKKYVTLNGKKVKLSNTKQVTVLKEKNIDKIKYYYVKFSYKKKILSGYIPETKLMYQMVSAKKVPTKNVTETSISDNSNLTAEEFKKKMENEGFPTDYVTKLCSLHEKYPAWDFKPFFPNLSWESVIKAESKVGLNLISNSKSDAWKSRASGAYNASTGTYVVFDGSSWVTASEAAVRYYMDPRNFLDAISVFQFESLAYHSTLHKKDGVENILKNTPMYNKKFKYTTEQNTIGKMKYSTAFMKAGEASQVSPYHLAARSKQEIVLSSTKMSSIVSGTVSGYYGLYNYYNIGAYNSTTAGGAVANGLKFAGKGTSYMRPWTDPYRAIVGGGKYIGEKYINVGQNTLYLQKFNVTSKNTYDHQYMANIDAPNAEGKKTYQAYGDMRSEAILFTIPVYNDMPSKVSAMPQ